MCVSLCCVSFIERRFVFVSLCCVSFIGRRRSMCVSLFCL